MRDIIYNGPECEVEAVCYILDTEDVALEVEYKYADGTAVIQFTTIDDMIQFATDVKLWAMRLQRKPEPKGCAEGFCGGCDCLGEGGES
jgi:hypothetical protein